jgi:hypothetical protein
MIQTHLSDNSTPQYPTLFTSKELKQTMLKKGSKNLKNTSIS